MDEQCNNCMHWLYCNKTSEDKYSITGCKDFKPDMTLEDILRRIRDEGTNDENIIV